MYAWLDHAIGCNATVLTASRRLARQLRGAHSDRCVKAGLSSWATPEIYFLGDWLATIVDSSADPGLGHRLNGIAATALWERCLREQQGARLPGFAGIVRQCRQTWARLHEWNVPLEKVLQTATGPEQRLFAQAAAKYQELLRANNWIDDATQVSAVAQMLAAGRIKVPAQIVVAGFDRIAPSVKTLLDALEKSACKVSIAQAAAVASSRNLHQFSDRNAELRAAGGWAREQLKQHPEKKLAIICPELERGAGDIARLVREGFAPGWQIAGDAHRVSVDVSYGRTLAEFPAIATALLLLRWLAGGLASKEVSILLRSRSLVGRDIPGRCRLETLLRRLPDQRWTPARLLGAMGNADANDDSDSWRQRMRHLTTRQDDIRQKRGPASWAEYFDVLLATCGWPGDETRSSEEFQLLNRWRELLNEFAALQNYLDDMDYPGAASKLAAMANEVVFQPEGELGVLPVLGMLEAAGLEFDGIWVCSFDSVHWPAPALPLPYLSRGTQQDYQMPDATAQDSLAFSRRVIDRISRSCASLELSWAVNDDGVEQQVSPLLAELAVTEDTSQADPGWYASTWPSSELVVADSDDIPPVTGDEQVSGGAYTVQRQVVDPFGAFAYGRLHLTDLAQFEAGLSASARGTLIHHALKLLYADLPTRADIAAWSDADLQQRLANAAEQACRPLTWHAGDVLRVVLAFEQTRLERLLADMVAEDRVREDFAIRMIEGELTYNALGLRLNLRVDRVDELQSGELFVIDYKSGAEKSLVRRDGELHDLQLVVYAMALKDPVAGVAIVNLDSRKVGIKASATGDDWSSQYSTWRASAEQAIRSFVAGQAQLNLALTPEQGRTLNVLSRLEELRNG